MDADSPRPALDFLETRERFLPVKEEAILRRMLDGCESCPERRQQFCMFLDMVRARFHFEFVKEIDSLKRLYDPFDPDRDTQLLEELSEGQREESFAELRRRFESLLLRGNYVKLTRPQLLACLESRNEIGLSVRVNLDDYEVLDVFYRGIRGAGQTYRSWSTWFLERTIPVRMFSRVAILVRRRRPRKGNQPARDIVLMKLFKDIVLEDLKMTSPEVRLQMKLLDKLKVGSTVAGGLATPMIKLFTAAIISPVVLLLVAVGFIGAFFKGVFSFLTSKTKYMQTLSSSLYYKNLANNVSALTRLVDAAESEEIKELLLAYYILYRRPDTGFTLEELDREVEAWLREQFQLTNVDFEVADAVGKLAEKNLIEVCPETADDGTVRQRLKALDLPVALDRLDVWWDDYFSPNGKKGC
ncbi:MAG: DUF3754 domain-containing protein [Thermoguttaceae bacterium]